MKHRNRILAILLALSLSMSLTACLTGAEAPGASAEPPVTETPTPSAEPSAAETPVSLEQSPDVDGTSGATQEVETQDDGQTVEEAGKILVAYFSRAGENYSVGTISEGNTAKLAKEIAAQTGADLFEIVPSEAYPDGYEETKTIATRERNNGERPAIAEAVPNFEDYDTVFIGYPIWWGDLPMILHTFMESYDFTGKTVIPFNTHEGSGQSGTQSAIANKLSTATVLQGLAMRGSTAQALQADGADATVANWLDGLGISKQAGTTTE